MALIDKINGKTETNDASVPQLVVELFNSRTKAHIFHLTTTSFAAHKASNDYYDAVVGIGDSLAEEYQGIAGIQKYGEYKMDTPDFIVYLQNLYNYCTKVQDSCKYSNIINTIDEAKSLINSTVYKLKTLK